MCKFVRKGYIEMDNEEKALNHAGADERKEVTGINEENKEFGQDSREFDIAQKEEAVDDNDSLASGTEEEKKKVEKNSEDLFAMNKADEEKKKRPAAISLKDKSERFKTIIDIAIEVEKLEEERRRLKDKNKRLTEDNKNLSEELEISKHECKKTRDEIEVLKSNVEHRDEVIDIVKADKSKSEEEYKNALAAELKVFYNDYVELKDLEMSPGIGKALADTLEAVFDTLRKKGINI